MRATGIRYMCTHTHTHTHINKFEYVIDASKSKFYKREWKKNADNNNYTQLYMKDAFLFDFIYLSIYLSIARSECVCVYECVRTVFVCSPMCVCVWFCLFYLYDFFCLWFHLAVTLTHYHTLCQPNDRYRHEKKELETLIKLQILAICRNMNSSIFYIG